MRFRVTLSESILLKTVVVVVDNAKSADEACEKALKCVETQHNSYVIKSVKEIELDYDND